MDQNNRRVIICLVSAALIILTAGIAAAATQDKYALPEPYLAWEKAYLKEFPELQGLMDVMIDTTVKQLKDPEADILHNRVCSALAYEMAKTLNKQERKLAIATDILHNISKEDRGAVLTNPEVLAKATGMVSKLKKAGYFKNSPGFWGDEAVLKNPKVGGNLGLIHHITGAMATGEIAAREKFPTKDVDLMQVAVLEHSTGYWYFRDSVDQAAGRRGAWQAVYPEPENEIAKIAHDADLISQFVYESVVPDGSKWRELAKKRWKAKDTKEEGHIVYYVFFRLYEEAKTEKGKALARQDWEKIRPELVKLMGLKPDEDPVKVLGVPKIFR
ncbi:MAG: hypothetical protein A4E73_01920 [Syntrophaceae bacterium PtaU1.Bin231]|nr:MAG: hypothetical protein A4E73_01920 [Syntrophaceae bacterium PtaU1.Bin231]